jgi:hypothetical protein
MRPALFTHQIHRSGTKGILLFAIFCLSIGHAPLTQACTVFKVTHNSRTLIGNNEDAWSINSQVRFVQGHNGDYGAIYFDHFNGHPFRTMGPQLGMNEAGLVFDGLTIQPQHATPVPGRKQVHFDDLMPQLMRTCATVHEAAAVLSSYDFSWLTRSMLFFADRNGDYLIVESDTMILGNDPTCAVGNWRTGTCSDPDAIPIPRLQTGRALLAEGTQASLEHGTAVLQVMKACRSKMGEGTIFSTLFDPSAGKAHLFFYHDFSERVTFDLKEELAKGDRTVVMASLFGERPEYDALVGYLTPFHQRWLFVVLLAIGAACVLALGTAAFIVVRRLFQKLMGRTRGNNSAPALLLASSAAVGMVLVPILLTQESLYYFGIGGAVDSVSPLLRYLPIVLMILVALLMRRTVNAWRKGEWGLPARSAVTGYSVILLSLVSMLFYWGTISSVFNAA